MAPLVTIAGILVAMAGAAAAQAPAPAAFEVASIRRNVSVEPGASVRVQPGGVLTVTNNTLFNIIRNAYNVQALQIIVEGPDWIREDRWDILAKAEGNPQGAQMMGLLQTLLADRLKADIRRETREMQVYALTVARSDGRLGPQLTPSSVDCAALAAARTAGAPPPPPRADGFPTCGMSVNAGVARAGGYFIADIARNLSGATGRMIVDRTGLTGRYDMELTWTPDPTQGPTSSTFDGGSLFTALQEQLGLKLESQRTPVEVLVVHAASRPTED